jgi:hypothetical protein
MFLIVAVRQHTLHDIVIKQYLSITNKDKPIPNSYPQLRGKVEAHNKIVKNPCTFNYIDKRMNRPQHIKKY